MAFPAALNFNSLSKSEYTSLQNFPERSQREFGFSESCFHPGKQDTDRANHSEQRNYTVDAKSSAQWVDIFLFRMLSALAPRHLVHNKETPIKGVGISSV